MRKTATMKSEGVPIVNGYATSKYGITLVRSCAYCTSTIYPTPNKIKNKGSEGKEEKLQKIKFRYNTVIWCSDDCKQLYWDERSVQKLIRDYERARMWHEKRKVEKQLLKQQKQNDNKRIEDTDK